MKASISLDALFDFLQSLQLSADNKTWLAEKLIESARESRQTVPGQMSVNEAKDLLKASEERFERGEYLTEEEMENCYNSHLLAYQPQS